jgi:hypothetical protein
MKTIMNKKTEFTGKKSKTGRIITAILGIALAISGMHHGFFEILQGNNPTNTMFIESIGESQRMWIHGSDDAFTLIPNFLITGIVSVVLSLFIIFWALFYLDKKYGTTIFLMLFILLTLTGGGIGYIPFFILTWAYATRMNTGSGWWNKVLPLKIKTALSKTWLIASLITASFFIIGLEISVFGYVPGVTEPDTILAVCWSFLFVALLFINYSYISGFAKDQVTSK